MAYIRRDILTMAVILRKTIKFGNQDKLTKVFEPSGVLSKEDRLRAERLDALLEVRIPEIADEILEEIPNEGDVVRRRHTLGKKVRVIVEDQSLVLQSDIDNMLVWQAIWQYLPKSMMPERTNIEKPYSDKQHKRQDHLSLCYELSSFSWKEASWIKRWTFVHEITARPSLLRDKRIFLALGDCISNQPVYPTIDVFREIMKNLVKGFPTKKYRDSTVFTDEEIYSRVSKAVNNTIAA
jgi:hypothetical protein